MKVKNKLIKLNTLSLMSKETKSKFQLHQLLAATSDRETQAVKLLNETLTSFEKRDSMFNGKLRKYEPLDASQDSDPIADEVEEVEIVYSVKEKLNYIKNPIANAWDSVLSKEETNSSGSASAVLKFGTVEIELSATSLLALHKRLVTVRKIYNTIPTLDPTKSWTYNRDRVRYESKETKRNRIIKKAVPLVVVQATDKFPAQTEVLNVDKKVGEYSEIHYSSKLKVSEKAGMLTRIDSLIDAVSVARAAANRCEVKEVKLAKNILDYING